MLKVLKKTQYYVWNNYYNKKNIMVNHLKPVSSPSFFPSYLLKKTILYFHQCSQEYAYSFENCLIWFILYATDTLV